MTRPASTRAANWPLLSAGITPPSDIEAAALAPIHADGKAGVVGYCWGASWVWVAACRLDIACAACYYGRHIVDLLDEKAPLPGDHALRRPRTPRFRRKTVEAIRAANPQIPIYLYEGAGHGFNCDKRADFRPEAAAVALERTLGFIRRTHRQLTASAIGRSPASG